MNCFSMCLDLKNDPEAIEKYIHYHKNVWPEVESALKEVGIISMLIFHTKGRLFMVMETKDDFSPEIDFPKYLEIHHKCKEWDRLMQNFQQKIPGAKESDWWSSMDLVYHLK